MKKNLSLFLFAAAVLPLAPVAAGSAAEPAAVLRWHSANPAGSARTRVGEFLRDEVAKRTDKLTVTIYPNAQLGSSDEVHHMIAMGENIASATDSAWFSSFQPGFDIINGPFFTETEADLYKVAETPWFKRQLADLEAKGIKILAPNWMDGSRYLMTTNFPVRNPADLAGKKIRVPNNKVAIDIMIAMGATAIPMPLTEMYPALQQGVIDGCENPFSTLYDRKTHEVCKYLALTAHQKMLSMFFVSAEWFNRLHPEAREALTRAAFAAGDHFSKVLMPGANEAALAAFRKAGVAVVGDIDIAAFKKATLGVYKNWSVDTYNLIQAELAGIE
ncbi:MAG: TRAP transporter substrate-binding protein DctP [Planctomycetota bacterium]|jgi:tripartite ATP-independent transporter DctP family solute receptor|nr:TRAP transporter substrate-binding protein DctP [Planctomycetota bacterium]